MVPLKYLNNFWRTLEIPLINWKFSLIFTWSAKRAIILILQIKVSHLK